MLIKSDSAPNSQISLTKSTLLTPMGDLTATVAGCLCGATAIQSTTLFGVAGSFAQFTDISLRHLPTCLDYFKTAIDLSGYGPLRTIFFFCAAKGDISSYPCNNQASNPVYDVLPLPGKQAQRVKQMLGISAAQTFVVSNACASGSIGVELATEYIRNGVCDHAILFGFDVLSKFVVTGFSALGAISSIGARPFDQTRDGLSLGECAVCAVLSRTIPRFSDIVVSGAGCSNDANHRTGPSRTGDGLYAAARAALTDAECTPADIGAVKCHGTATVYNDAMEAKAIHRLFDGNCPPCFSVKGALGHLSGAGSLAEICMAAELLKQGVVPPTGGYAQHGVDEKISLSSEKQTLRTNRILCLAAGFGGINSAVVLSKNIKEI